MYPAVHRSRIRGVALTSLVWESFRVHPVHLWDSVDLAMNKEVKEDSETKSKISGGECVRCIFVRIYTFYLMVAKFLDFRFVLRCVFFGFVLYCFVSLIVLFRFVSRFVLFLFLLLFCSLHCKDCKAPGRIQEMALDLCMLAARFFAEMLIFHWFYKVYITPAGSNKKCL